MGQEQSNPQLYFLSLPTDLLLPLFSYFTSDHMLKFLENARFTPDFQKIFESESLFNAVWKHYIPTVVKRTNEKNNINALIQAFNDKKNAIVYAFDYRSDAKILALLHDIDDYNFAMKYAALNDFTCLIDDLLQLGANDLNTTMEYAARGDNLTTVNEMIELGCKNFNQTLIEAAECGSKKVVQRMLDLKVESWAICKAAHIAALNGHVGIVDDLLQNYRGACSSALTGARIGNSSMIGRRNPNYQKITELVEFHQKRRIQNC